MTDLDWGDASCQQGQPCPDSTRCPDPIGCDHAATSLPGYQAGYDAAIKTLRGGGVAAIIAEVEAVSLEAGYDAAVKMLRDGFAIDIEAGGRVGKWSVYFADYLDANRTTDHLEAPKEP